MERGGEAQQNGKLERDDAAEDIGQSSIGGVTSFASAARTVCRKLMTQRHGGVPSDSFVSLLHLVNGAQYRQLFVVKCAGGFSDAGREMRVSCAAPCEPVWGPVSLLLCGDLNWCTRGVESSVRIRCIGTSSLCAVGAETKRWLWER